MNSKTIPRQRAATADPNASATWGTRCSGERSSSGSSNDIDAPPGLARPHLRADDPWCDERSLVAPTMRSGKNHDAPPGIASTDGFAPFRVHAPCLVEGGEAGKIRRETGKTRRELAALHRECFNAIRGSAHKSTSTVHSATGAARGGGIGHHQPSTPPDQRTPKGRLFNHTMTASLPEAGAETMASSVATVTEKQLSRFPASPR
jgi:hypothetical protein